MFSGAEKGCIVNKWVDYHSALEATETDSLASNQINLPLIAL